MAVLDAIARSCAIALMAAMGLVLLRARPRALVVWTMCGLFASIAGYLVRSSPDFDVSSPLEPLLRTAALAAPAVFWSFTRAFFGDDERPEPLHVVVLATTVVVGLARPGRIADALYYAGSVALVGGALAHVVRGLAADLVEPRRRVRAAFSIVVGLEILVIIAIELWLAGTAPSRELELFKSVGALVLTVLFAAWLLTPRADLTAALPSPVQAVGAPTVAESHEAPDADARFRHRLIAAMEREHLYRQEGLTIRALADSLEVPEYRLRRIINEQLGHRNFNAFLNELRTAEACRILADPNHGRLPILNLALDLGYGSVGPFNRAFRAKTGLTPTEFRQAYLPRLPGVPAEESSAES